jgi:hypothetical protein
MFRGTKALYNSARLLRGKKSNETGNVGGCVFSRNFGSDKVVCLPNLMGW